MTKAYDLADLLQRFKADGIAIAHDEAIRAYGHLKDWLKESAAVSSTPIDNVVVSFVDQLDPIVLPQIDKIKLPDAPASPAV
jgi:hypothetical protein